MDRNEAWRTGLALAITLVLINVVCGAAIALWPDASLDYANAWMHGIDLSLIKSRDHMSVRMFLQGVVGLAILGFAVGSLYALVAGALRRGKAGSRKVQS